MPSSALTATVRLAIVATHPIQYYAPWFRELAKTAGLVLRVCYLWDFGVSEKLDQGFQKVVTWNIPLLEGYEGDFVPNQSTDAGTHHFWGLQNPTLRQHLTAFRPDAVLIYGYNYASLLSLICLGLGASEAPRRRVPLIFRGDSHRLTPRTGVKESLRRMLISLVYRRFSAFLDVGEANRDYFRYHGVPERKLFRAPHAIDNDRFLNCVESATAAAGAWRSEVGIPVEHRVVLFVGKFERKKRPDDLLAAFARARSPMTSLLFVGDGELANSLREAAATVPNVYFAPFQNQAEMPRTYAAGDLLVLPSFGAEESWGLVVNEAMCMGLPAIVSSHVGCARDLVLPRETGLLFEAGDIDGLAEALKDALSDADRLRKWGSNARERIQRFSYAQVTKGLMSALRSVVGNGELSRR